jgi:DNA helicase-2/ATP-dependent DNA helicase PcrA
VLENREEGARLKDQAVLFRTSSHSGPLEIELTRHNIPFVKFGGLKFLDAAHVKDMLALLRFVENPRDRVAGFRILHLLPGVGPASRRVLDPLAESADPVPHCATFPRRPAPARTGRLSFARSRICAIRHGRLTSNARGSGTNRISIASTRTPRSAAPI